MNTGKETWKWALVVILLAVFLITANQAYEHLANQEDFAPPETTPDSWELEHNLGPGSGQPTTISENNNSFTPNKPSIKVNQRLSTVKPIVFDDKSDWNQVSDTTPTNSDSKNSQTNVNNQEKQESKPEKKVEQPISQVNEKQSEQSIVVEKPKVEQPVKVEPVEAVESKKQEESSEKVEQPQKASEEKSSDENSITETLSTMKQPSSEAESTTKE